jgi:uncharacterized protein DUF4382
MRWPVAFALVAAIAASACGGSGTGPSGSGTLRMMIKDSPFSDAQALLVTFQKVSVHQSDTPDGAWTDVTTTPRTCDLKRLQNVQDILGTTTLTAGHYTQIRLVVATAAIFFNEKTTGDTCAASFTMATQPTNVTIPSGEVKLNREFDIQSNTTNSISLDFDGDKSVREMGNGAYSMSPVISIVAVQQ